MLKKYNTCDGIYTIFNTIYLTFGISIIITIITILLLLLLTISSDIMFFRHLFFILIYCNILFMPFILTYLHINKIKYKCSNNSNNNIFNNKLIKIRN